MQSIRFPPQTQLRRFAKSDIVETGGFRCEEFRLFCRSIFKFQTAAAATWVVTSVEGGCQAALKIGFALQVPTIFRCLNHEQSWFPVPHSAFRPIRHISQAALGTISLSRCQQHSKVDPRLPSKEIWPHNEYQYFARLLPGFRG